MAELSWSCEVKPMTAEIEEELRKLVEETKVWLSKLKSATVCYKVSFADFTLDKADSKVARQRNYAEKFELVSLDFMAVRSGEKSLAVESLPIL